MAPRRNGWGTAVQKWSSDMGVCDDECIIASTATAFVCAEGGDGDEWGDFCGRRHGIEATARLGKGRVIFHLTVIGVEGGCGAIWLAAGGGWHLPIVKGWHMQCHSRFSLCNLCDMVVEASFV